MSFAPTVDLPTQVGALRSSVGLSLHDHWTLLQLDADDGRARLDPRVATGLAIREAQYRQGLALDEGGRPIADLLIGFFRGSMRVFATGMARDALTAALGAEAAHQRHADHVVIGLDGPFAWELLGAWDSPMAIGLPYLGAYGPRDGVHVVRAGRTGEYGYLIVLPRAQAEAEWARLVQLATAMDGVVVGDEALDHCAHQNWVFDIAREGAHGLDALELQLTWRLDLHKQAVGLDAIRAHRAEGVRRRICAIESQDAMAVGATVSEEGTPIGTVLSTRPRLLAPGHTAVAVVDADLSYPGMVYAVDGQPGRTVSPPFVLNRSLFVNPQRHTWAHRDEIELPEAIRWPTTTSS